MCTALDDQRKGQAETTAEDEAAALNRDEAKVAATSIRDEGNFCETVNGNESMNGNRTMISRVMVRTKSKRSRSGTV